MKSNIDVFSMASFLLRWKHVCPIARNRPPSVNKILSILIFVLIVGLSFHYIIAMFENYEDITSVCEKLIVISLALLGSQKHCIIIRDYEKIQSLFMEYSYISMKIIQTERNLTTLKKYCLLQKKAVTFFIGLVMTSLPFFIAISILNPKTKSFFEFAQQYPWPKNVIWTVIDILYLVYVCNLYFVYDGIVYSLLVAMSGYCVALSNELQFIDNIDLCSSEVRKHLLKTIKLHQSVIKTRNLLNGIYENTMIAQFMLMSAYLSMSLYCIFQAPSGSYIPFILATLCGLNQYFGFCIMGELLKQKSLAIPKACYNIKWFELPIDIQKNLLFIQTISADFTLSQYRVFPMDLQSFVKVMQTVYSLVTLYQRL